MEVLVEQNFCGKAETSYVYGVDRLSYDNYWGLSTYYLYDGRGSVTGLTGEKGCIYQSYRYSVTGEITFGEPHHNNEYTYNGESYNPNIESQYLRARYYNVVTATFLTEDSYLGEITNPLTLNRYNYTLSNYLNYQDPSGHVADYIVDIAFLIIGFVDLCRNPSWANAGWLVVDGILAAVPVIPNIAAARHIGKLNKVSDGFNYVKKAVSGAFKATKKTGCEVLEESIEKTVKEAAEEVVEEATEKTGKEMLEETAESQLDEAGKALDGNPSGADEMLEGATSAKGLIGHDFEDYLSKTIGGEGSFSVGGRDFDGGIGNRWWEAKSGNYWSMLEENPNKLAKFKSDMGDRLRIATENGATYEIFSNTPIPESIKQWLTKKGITFTELLD